VESVDKFLDFYAAKPGGWPEMCSKLEEKYLAKLVLPDPSPASPKTIQKVTTGSDLAEVGAKPMSKISAMRAKVAAAEANMRK